MGEGVFFSSILLGWMGCPITSVPDLLMNDFGKNSAE